MPKKKLIRPYRYSLNPLQVNEFLSSQENTAKQKMTMEEVAMGFIQVANEAMCRPIRALTQVKDANVRG